MTETLEYKLELSDTQLATGFFTTVPSPPLSLEQGLALLKERPMDQFLHRYVLDLMARLDEKEIARLIKQAKTDGDRELQALACEQILLSHSLAKVEQFFSKETITELCNHTPLVDIRAALLPNTRLHTQWIDIFKSNIVENKPLPTVEETGLPPICAGECMVRRETRANIDDLISRDENIPDTKGKFSAEQTAQTAMERLERAGIEVEEEMRHESSLSPFALLRRWRFATKTDNHRNRFTLSGPQTSYGKGLTLEDARASLSMEIVERCSSFASISATRVEGYANNYPLVRATYSDLMDQGRNALNPADLSLEVSYGNEPLHWIEGVTPGNNGPEPAMVPVQPLFLFCNLDEIALFSGLGSTGLASGNTMEQAKVSALLEVIERHQEATVPFDKQSCFRVVPGKSEITPLLETYAGLGIQVQFQDITPPSGIPCCKCFVMGQDGAIHKGAAAHLDARRALVSAMTETTYPFPSGPPSAKGMADLIPVGYDNLPDYSTPDYGKDLALLENLLTANGQRPYYVDLTRKDIGLPVVKALIPGMDILGDFDRFSRVHPELFRNYMNRFGTNN
ncbi:MAG: YcaO-like family protein [Desulfobacteraceae bacterium]|nr:YcaO-like family protein [Desulfobacteraceae bacterium]